MKKFLHTLYAHLYLLTASALWLPYSAQADGLSFDITSHITVTSIEGLLVAILNIFIIIATPLIVLYIIYAGFLYVTARGNAQQIEQATKALTYAIIGGILIIGSVALSQIIANVVGDFKA